VIVTAKMNDIDPQAWLADVLARIAEHPVQKLDELLPWNWRRSSAQILRAAWARVRALSGGAYGLPVRSPRMVFANPSAVVA
jgi:IS66 C-terminal element